VTRLLQYSHGPFDSIQHEFLEPLGIPSGIFVAKRAIEDAPLAIVARPCQRPTVKSPMNVLCLQGSRVHTSARSVYAKVKARIPSTETRFPNQPFPALRAPTGSAASARAISLQNAGKSVGTRDEMMFPSTTTSVSS
jgi:hypothetical protein